MTYSWHPAHRSERGWSLCMKKGHLKTGQLCTLFVNTKCRAQLQNLAELIAAVLSVCRMCFFTKPRGWFRTTPVELSVYSILVYKKHYPYKLHAALLHIYTVLLLTNAEQ